MADDPEFLIGQMRVQTMREITFFHVTNRPTPFTDLDRDLDPMLDSLYEAKAQANLGGAGPDDTVPAGESELWVMEVGVAVKPGTQPAGASQVKTLPPYRCAGLLLWGSLAHIGSAYEALQQAMREAGLEHTGESREWVYYFESGESPHNLMGLYMGIQ